MADGKNGAATPTSKPNTPPAGAGTHGGSSSGTDGNSQLLHQKRRSKIPWNMDVWDRIDAAVAFAA